MALDSMDLQNAVINFLNDIQHNQWDLMDRVASVRRSQRHLHERLNRVEGCLGHIKHHAHEGLPLLD